MIRKAEAADLPALYKVFRAARERMAAAGNTGQWGGGYPECMLEEDIRRGQLYVLCGEDGAVHAAFAFVLGEDPSYAVIDGAWTSSGSYGTIHRLGSDGTLRGVFAQCLDFCARRCPHIRADTHEKNGTMRRLLEKHGFVCCGRINLDRQAGDALRLAYEYDKENGAR